jgi:hypothetical protein
MLSKEMAGVGQERAEVADLGVPAEFYVGADSSVAGC